MYQLGAIDVGAANGDDLVVANLEAEDTRVLVNDGSLGFTPVDVPTAGRTLLRFFGGQFDSEPDGDFVYVSTERIIVAAGNGSGGFLEQLLVDRSVSIVTRFHDAGRGRDAIAAPEPCDPCTDDAIAGVYVLGSGAAVGRVTHGGAFAVDAIAAGTVDADAQEDLVLVRNLPTPLLLLASGWNGAGFANQVPIPVERTASVVAADLDGDGFGDLALLDAVRGVVSVMLGAE